MSTNWRAKMEENNKKGESISFIQTYFKLPPNSKEKRSIKELAYDIAQDLKFKFGKDKAKQILTNKL